MLETYSPNMFEEDKLKGTNAKELECVQDTLKCIDIMQKNLSDLYLKE